MPNSRTQFQLANMAKAVMGIVAFAASALRANTDQGAFGLHPANAQLNAFFAARSDSDPEFQPTSLSRKDYLPLIAANIDHWAKFQDENGAIIDPDSKGERQYSTPAFAAAAALLVAEAGRTDLLEPALRAMTFATHQLAIGKAADGHSDFYIPILMHARRILRPFASAEVINAWDADLRSIEPTKIYNMNLKGMNWNLVSSCGELLRRKDGLVAAERKADQWSYLEARLADHSKSFTKYGMYADPGVPLAYDAFGRLWLDDMMANGAYDGSSANAIDEFLTNGGLSTLLLLSPTGEWPGGGRSALHNWCEAEAIVICEIHAARWMKAGRPDVAGSFKRAAHLAFESMSRWQRPSGELNIIKNRFDPKKRFAYESYSNHSQYNLLPMAMLTIAYQHADDAIPEKPIPSEAGNYVFDLRETFHKIVASAGGYYVLIDTAGDPHYNSTGLQRIHRSRVPFSPLTDSSVSERGYGKNDGPSQTLVPGLQWQTKNGIWESLGNARLPDPSKSMGDQVGTVRNVELTIQNTPANDSVSFEVTWTLEGRGIRKRERYGISQNGVTCNESVTGNAEPFLASRVVLPVTAFDGEEKSTIELGQGQSVVTFRGGKLRWKTPGSTNAMQLDPAQSPAHPGLLQAITQTLPMNTTAGNWSIELESADK